MADSCLCGPSEFFAGTTCATCGGMTRTPGFWRMQGLARVATPAPAPAEGEPPRVSVPVNGTIYHHERCEDGTWLVQDARFPGVWSRTTDPTRIALLDRCWALHPRAAAPAGEVTDA